MTSKYVKGDSQLIKELNAALILDIVREAGEISRIDIAKKSKLSPPAVSVIIAELLERDLLLEVGKAPSTGGRRPRLLTFNPQAGYLVGVDVGSTKMLGGVVDLGGNITTTLEWPTTKSEAPLERLIKLIQELITKSNLNPEKILGVGVGIPGVVDPQDKVATFSPGVGWDNINIAQEVSQAIGLPVWTDNEANAKVQGEFWKGELQGVRQGLCLTIGHGIGVGLLLNGEVYLGKQGAAGEIGYWLLNDSRPIRRPEGYGELESYAAGAGIVARAQAYLDDHPEEESILRMAPLTAKTVFDAAREMDIIAQKIVNETTKTLGIAIANLSSLLDIETVVLSGGITRAGDMLRQPIENVVNTLTPYPPKIVISELQERAGILGAAHGFMIQNRTHIIYSELAV